MNTQGGLKQKTGIKREQKKKTGMLLVDSAENLAG